MRTLQAASWIAATALAARGISGTVSAVSSLRWLHQGLPAEPTAGTRFVLVVPLLREQALIGSLVPTLTSLAATHPGTSVVLVTTEAENNARARDLDRAASLAGAVAADVRPGRIVTRFLGLLPAAELEALARQARGQDSRRCAELVGAALAANRPTPELAAEQAREAVPGTVRHCHYPEPDGSMVQQLNYAIRNETERARAAGTGMNELFFVIYNADSRPHPDTLRAAAALIAAREHAPSGPARLIQQSAVFTANFADLPPGLAGAVLEGAGWLQSRWTMSREIPRLRRQAAYARHHRDGTLMPLAHCVGHGLMIRADLFAELGGLPESTGNEDLALGYLACAAGVPIDPLPLLEEAHTPLTLSSWLSQARQWFLSYPQYPAAAALAAAAGHGTPARRCWLTAQGLARGVLWLGQSPAVALAIALPGMARHRRSAAVLTGCGLAGYFAVPAWLTARVTGRPIRLGRALPGGLVAMLLSSIGPWRSLADAAAQVATGDRPSHRKTER
ncbi:MAG TPA: glycosyltransferase family 2 protein [Streptosporangiaceae bacterium]